VVVKVFVTERQCIDALGYELFDCMLDEVGVMMVCKTGCKISNDVGQTFDL
jgi:hypothetical protein